jgi:hypothetical protein
MPSDLAGATSAVNGLMRPVRWLIVGGLLFAVACWLTLNLGLPPWTWIEKSRFVAKAEAALATTSSPTLLPHITGDVFSYSDGWIVVLYGQSVTTGHNLWNYNLAKDSNGHEYICERHFCTGIRHRYDMRKKSDEYYLKNNPEATTIPNPPDAELDSFKKLIEADSLAEALTSLTVLGFTKR